MNIQTSLRRIVLVAATGAVFALSGAAYAQQRGTGDEAPRQVRDTDPTTGQVCRPMCAEDMSPCDSPTMKAREGRCSSPSAGFVG